MSSKDAKNCFLPHATSKITCLDDLEKINTFGFRGEALASISAVSKITLTTKEKESPETLGTYIEYENSKFTKTDKVSCNSGVDLQISELFYNTPARKKFLKRDETEWNQIQNIVHAFCLSNLNIHFKLYRDGKEILNTPAALTLKDRISQIWGHNFATNLLELKSTKTHNSIVNISGQISNHNFWRYGRSDIFFFVNNRYVKNQNLSKGLLKGYLNVLPPAKFPASFIFINLDPTLIDVNVHPRKEEVAFSKPETIKNAISTSVKQTLENYVSEKLSYQKNQTEPYEFNFNTSPFTNNLPAQQPNIANQFSEKNVNPLLENSTTQIQPKKIFFEQTTNDKQSNFSNKSEPKYVEQQTTTYYHGNKIIGQLFNTYILIDQEDSLVVIDQHAAHERILYEQFDTYFKQKEGIQLLFPEILKLNENQIDIVLNQKEFFQNQGIEIEQLGKTEIAIKTSPPKIQSQNLKELIFELVDFMQEHETLEKEEFYKKLNKHTHTQMACKAAIKAGDILSNLEMEKLIEDLQKTNNKLICAHGRPTTWIISKNEIEKNFKRKK